MTVTVPRVAALWGAANGVLVAVLIAYGENSFAIALYAAVVALLEIVALATWLSWTRRRDAALHSPAALRSESALVTAVGVGFVGAGFVYHWWMALPAAYSLLWLAARGAHALVERYLPAERTAVELRERHDDVQQPASGVVVSAATVATAAVVGRRWWRRRS